MVDWKEMYLTMVRESEKAIRILIAAQQKCEEMYIEADDGESEDEEENAQKKDEKPLDKADLTC